RDSTYVSRRSPNWIKLKCTHRQEFVVVGYSDPEGSRVGIGALLLAIHDERGELRYAGKVGTGFDTKTLGQLRKRLRHSPPTSRRCRRSRPKRAATGCSPSSSPKCRSPNGRRTAGSAIRSSTACATTSRPR